jgi:nicotinic acid mononucleotide adenylyltransferase
MALARAALSEVEEVLFVLPRAFPHKAYEQVGLEDRLRMVELAIAGEARFQAAVTDGGLFIDIAREVRSHYGGSASVVILCGRDAAERIIHWDYGAPGAFAAMLEEFELLVAARHGGYDPPAEYRSRIRTLELDQNWDHVSATEVRRRIAAGQDWAHMVPATIVEMVGNFYSP